MPTETRHCLNCQTEFTIEAEDFAFYEKMQVPPPTWCPMCRAQRRLAWRAERALFKRTCAATGKEIFSMFHPDAPATVVDNEYWWSDKWDGADYGQDIDWNRPLLAQLKELAERVPRPARSVYQVENSDYSNNAGFLKNCYLVFSAEKVENSMYCTGALRSRDCFDSNYVFDCELCYGCVMCSTCYRCYYSIDCDNSSDLLFCKNVSNSSHCLGSVNLKNKTYCIFNEQHTKDEYEKKLSSYALHTREGVENFQKEFEQFLKRFPVNYTHENANDQSSGEYLFNTHAVTQSYFVSASENCKYCQFVMQPATKDAYDYSFWGTNAELMVETIMSGTGVSRIKFSYDIYPNSMEIEYSMLCCSSSNLFLCAGLKNKQYCILNKQYTKDEYERLVPKLREHMATVPYTDAQDRVYRYGELFPPEFLPFAYNETLAYELFPLTKEEAEQKGYTWREPDKRQYTTTLNAGELPSNIMEVDDGILKQTIGCAHAGTCAHNCSTAFRIQPQELAFYRSHRIPLPQLCANCRHHSRLRWRNDIKQQHRACMCAGNASENQRYQNQAPHGHAETHCNNSFETSYPDDRETIVYCAECYRSEVA